MILKEAQGYLGISLPAKLGPSPVTSLEKVFTPHRGTQQDHVNDPVFREECHQGRMPRMTSRITLWGPGEGGSGPASILQAPGERLVGIAGGPLIQAACGWATVAPAIGRSCLAPCCLQSPWSEFTPAGGSAPHHPWKEGSPWGSQGCTMLVKAGLGGVPSGSVGQPQCLTAAFF